MKKIIAVIDAVNFSEKQLDSITGIAALFDNTLSLLLLEDTKSASRLISSGYMESFAGEYYNAVRQSEEEKKVLVEDNYAALKKVCKEKNITCTIKNIQGVAEDEVTTASRFADLLIIGKELSFPFLYDTDPTGFVKNMLSHAECPVLVIPDNLTNIPGVAFCYNGTPASMHAIKAFAAIFPDLITKGCEILYVGEKGKKNIPYKSELQEYLKVYNAHLKYKILTGPADKTLQSYLDTKPGFIATFGAYGRSRVSRFFNSSNADNILRNIKGPVFITH